MKNIILSFAALLSFNSFAADMSSTENWKEVYKENTDGSLVYTGACTTHQDYEGNKFFITKTLVKYFSPFDMDAAVFSKKLKKVEAQLIKATESFLNGQLIEADDITIETIKSTVISNLDLYRLNIGVGGGNGMFLVFNRTLVNGVPSYELVSNIFDGDIESCDSKVWLK